MCGKLCFCVDRKMPTLQVLPLQHFRFCFVLKVQPCLTTTAVALCSAKPAHFFDWWISFGPLFGWGVTVSGLWPLRCCPASLLPPGFHLSATVVSPQAGQSKGAYNVAVMFDRCRITSCSCTCGAGAKWCAHVVALCLFRIHNVSWGCW